ncbi:type II toxin-antitoxin system VapB family antitoxin [Kitasatospora sp. NPDC059408]|uniref:type II toxin-antitoxin system VapB family antitoxin n=1 Tax=Kitasatospora sp. NPDC059408 TaxID=3346823 RepID=UPI0036A13292
MDTARIALDVIDGELLAEAAEILGTTTAVATVNAALEETVNHRKGRRFPDRPAGGGVLVCHVCRVPAQAVVVRPYHGGPWR